MLCLIAVRKYFNYMHKRKRNIFQKQLNEKKIYANDCCLLFFILGDLHTIAGY